MTLWINKNGWAVVLPEHHPMLSVWSLQRLMKSRGFEHVGYVGGTLDQVYGDKLLKIEKTEDIETFKGLFEVTMEYRLQRLENIVNHLKVKKGE